MPNDAHGLAVTIQRSGTPTEGHPGGSAASALLLVVAVAAALRLYGIGDRPLELDEGSSYWFSNQTWTSLWTFIPTFETNPPLYYSLLKAWRLLFGDGEAALRALSVAASLVAVPILFACGRIIAGPREGTRLALLAALLFAVWPVQVEFAQFARAYAALSSSAALAVCGLIWLMRHPEHARRPLFEVIRGRGPDGAMDSRGAVLAAWAAVVVGVALSLWLHNLGIFVAATLAPVALVWAVARRERRLPLLGNLLGAGLAAVALWSPHLPWFFMQLDGFRASFTNFPEPTPSAIAYEVLRLIGLPFAWSTVTFLPLAVPAGGGLVWVGRRAGWPISLLLAAIVIVPMGLTVVGSVLFKPMLQTRFLVWTTIGFILALAAGLAAIRSTWLRALAVGLVVALAAKGLLDDHARPVDQPWDRVVRSIAAAAGPNDVVLVMGNAFDHPFSYYRQRLGTDLAVVPLPKPYPALGLPNPYPTSPGQPAVLPGDIAAMREAIDGRAGVWLVTFHPNRYYDPEDLVLGALHGTRRLVSHLELSGIDVFRFE